MTDEPGGTPRPERPIGRLFDKLFSDEEFVARLQRDPEATLRQTGFEFTEEEWTELRQGLASPPGVPQGVVAPGVIPAVVVVVQVATRPLTAPVVTSQVAVAVEAVTSHHVEERRAEEDDATE
jgi:hypothetical protein